MALAFTAAVTETSYDKAGRLLCTAIRMNPNEFALPPRDACLPGTVNAANGPDRISQNVYDEAGQLIEAWDGIGTSLARREALYGYDLDGRKTSLTDARGYRAEMSYDGQGRQSRWIFPSPTTAGVANPADYEDYGYDPNGNRTRLRKRDGTTLTFQYDALNRMTVKTVPTSATGAPGYAVYTGYDDRGLQTSARFGAPRGVGITHTYDGFGRLIAAWTDMDGTLRRLSSEYDPDGNRTILWDNGVSYSGKYGYDGLGRMSYYLEGFGPTAFQIFYDAAGRRSRVELGVGGVSSTMSYGYDPVGRLATLTRDLAGSGDQVLGFTYTPASQIATRSSTNDAYAWTGSYAVNRPYATNGLNQYGSAGDATFAYDPNGNLKTVASPTLGTTNYVYDAENRLVSASGAKNAALSYDPLGRLWQVSAPTGMTRFLYDGDQLIQEYNGAGTLLRDYDFGPGTDAPLIWHEYAGGFSRRFLHADQQGSIVAVTDTSGNAIAINSYDDYGIPKLTGLEAGRFGYTGQAWIPELGLYYYKARFYSPTSGRFMQTDPVGYKDQINLYAYVGDDPVNKNDPTGLDSTDAANWAYAMRGNTDYQESDGESRVGGLRATMPIFGNGGVGAPKCNFFVYDALKAGGVAPRTVDGIRGKIPTASMHWSNKRSNIEGYRPLRAGEKPQPGDVVSNKGHVGIVVGAPYPRPGGPQMQGYITASAADADHGDKVTITGFGFRKDDDLSSVVVWRYTPKPAPAQP
jgi:RHS repeat-associated protein